MSLNTSATRLSPEVLARWERLVTAARTSAAFEGLPDGVGFDALAATALAVAQSKGLVRIARPKAPLDSFRVTPHGESILHHFTRLASRVVAGWPELVTRIEEAEPVEDVDVYLAGVAAVEAAERDAKRAEMGPNVGRPMVQPSEDAAASRALWREVVALERLVAQGQFVRSLINGPRLKPPVRSFIDAAPKPSAKPEFEEVFFGVVWLPKGSASQPPSWEPGTISRFASPKGLPPGLYLPLMAIAEIVVVIAAERGLITRAMSTKGIAVSPVAGHETFFKTLGAIDPMSPKPNPVAVMWAIDQLIGHVPRRAD